MKPISRRVVILFQSFLVPSLFYLQFFAFLLSDSIERLRIISTCLLLRILKSQNNKAKTGCCYDWLALPCLSAQQEDAAAFCFWVSIVPPFFSPFYIPSCFSTCFFFCFSCVIFFPFFPSHLSTERPHLCVWFGPHTSVCPFPPLVYYFSILVRHFV